MKVAKNSNPQKPVAKPSIKHIFHIAASPADNAENPCWNASMALDKTSWKTLPDELRKVRIWLHT